MKKNHLLTALLIGQFLSVQVLFAIDIPENPKSHFYSAKQELVNMLEGKTPLDYERAIFIIEDAYWENKNDFNLYQSILDFHTENILRIIAAKNNETQNFNATLLETEEQKKEKCA